MKVGLESKDNMISRLKGEMEELTAHLEDVAAGKTDGMGRRLSVIDRGAKGKLGGLGGFSEELKDAGGGGDSLESRLEASLSSLRAERARNGGAPAAVGGDTGGGSSFSASGGPAHGHAGAEEAKKEKEFIFQLAETQNLLHDILKKHNATTSKRSKLLRRSHQHAAGADASTADANGLGGSSGGGDFPQPDPSRLARQLCSALPGRVAASPSPPAPSTGFPGRLLHCARHALSAPACLEQWCRSAIYGRQQWRCCRQPRPLRRRTRRANRGYAQHQRRRQWS